MVEDLLQKDSESVYAIEKLTRAHTAGIQIKHSVLPESISTLYDNHTATCVHGQGGGDVAYSEFHN